MDLCRLEGDTLLYAPVYGSGGYMFGPDRFSGDKKIWTIQRTMPIISHNLFTAPG
jgi:hypothetical protein